MPASGSILVRSSGLPCRIAVRAQPAPELGPVELDRLLPLGTRRSIRSGPSLGSLAGLELRCLAPFAEALVPISARAIPLTPARSVIASMQCPSLTLSADLSLALPVSDEQLRRLGMPCFLDLEQGPQLAGIVVGRSGEDSLLLALNRSPAMDQWLHQSAGLWSREQCDRPIAASDPFHLVLEPSIVSGVPAAGDVSVLGFGRFAATKRQLFWRHLAPPFNTQAWVDRNGSIATIDFQAPLSAFVLPVTPGGSTRLGISELSHFYEWTEASGVSVDTDIGFGGSYAPLRGAGESLSFVSPEGYLGIYLRASQSETQGSSLSPEAWRQADPSQSPSSWVDAHDPGLIHVAFRTRDGALASRSASAECLARCAYVSAGRCTPWCAESDVTWELPSSLDRVVVASGPDALWAVSSDADGELRLWQLDHTSPRVTAFGYLGARSVGTPALGVIDGDPYVAHAGYDLLPHFASAASCLGTSPEPAP